jgi:hypothetical protein
MYYNSNNGAISKFSVLGTEAAVSFVCIKAKLGGKLVKTIALTKSYIK